VVRLDKIVTKAGDGGKTRLSTGEQVSKAGVRVEAYGAVDEVNAVIGVARLHASGETDALLARIQNDLFDLGADLATPERGKPLPFEALRITDAQVDRLEAEVDAINDALTPLTSFILNEAADETVSPAAVKYLNRLSDLLFVAARAANDGGKADVLWTPGANR
jgi:cob(I)alamin adenosyltransferase